MFVITVFIYFVCR